MDYQSTNNGNQNKTKQLNKKMLIIAVIAIAIIIILIVSLSSINRTPSKQQLQDDLIQHELDDDNLTISDFSVYSEEKIDNKYTAIVSVTYEKDFVEYDEKYFLTYSKYDNWMFYDVDNYDKNLWSKKPTAPPNVDEYTELCLDKLENYGHCYEYDSFVFNESKSISDLESGEAIYAFDVKRDAVIESRSGEIDFSINFDFDRGIWKIEEITYSDSYEATYDFLHSWSGTLKCNYQSGWYDYDTDDKNTKFSITEFKKESDEIATVKGELVFGNKTYDMSGTIFNLTEYVVRDYYGIIMTGSDEKVCRLEGTLNSDGSLSIDRLNRDYTGNDDSGVYFYNTYDIFRGEMEMQ